MASFSLRAFAKINLSLRIRDVREDGFHEIQTVFQAIDLADRLTFETRRGPFEIRCNQSGVPVDRTNLVSKAAREMWSAAGRAGEPRDVRVILEKHIPMQAGLGGGSSNAATALLGFLRTWKVRMSQDDLFAIAARLGSDVPYFLVGGTALGLGRGEEVYPLVDLPRMWAVLAMPTFGIATKDAYAWWDENRSRVQCRAREGRVGTRSFFPSLPSPLVNDFEPPVIARHPMIAELKDHLQQRGALIAAMSGSGSAVFGLFGARAAAKKAARALKRPAIETRCARFLPRPKR